MKMHQKCEISAAERTGGLPWVDLSVGGWPAQRQQCVGDTKMHKKRVPLNRKCVRNAHPSHESASKMRTLRQKVDVQSFEVLGTKCTCPPRAFLSNKHYSGCSISTRAWAAGWLGAWLAGWLVGWPAGWLAKPKMRQKRVPLARKCVENAHP